MRASGFFMHRPVQMNFAAEAAHGPRIGRAKSSLPDIISATLLSVNNTFKYTYKNKAKEVKRFGY